MFPHEGVNETVVFHSHVLRGLRFLRGLGRGYVKIGLFTDFFDVNQKSNFVELIYKIIDCAVSSGLLCFRCVRVNSVS